MRNTIFYIIIIAVTFQCSNKTKHSPEVLFTKGTVINYKSSLNELSKYKVIDSLILDFNKDNLKDKVIILESIARDTIYKGKVFLRKLIVIQGESNTNGRILITNDSIYKRLRYQENIPKLKDEDNGNIIVIIEKNDDDHGYPNFYAQYKFIYNETLKDIIFKEKKIDKYFKGDIDQTGLYTIYKSEPNLYLRDFVLGTDKGSMQRNYDIVDIPLNLNFKNFELHFNEMYSSSIGQYIKNKDTVFIKHYDGENDSFDLGGITFSLSKDDIKINASITLSFTQYFTDDVRAKKIFTVNYPSKIEILKKDNVFKVPEYLNSYKGLGVDFNDWLYQNYFQKIKTISYPLQKDFYEENFKSYENCCPEYLNEASEFLGKEKSSFDSFEELGVFVYIDRITLEFKGKTKEGEEFIEYLGG